MNTKHLRELAEIMKANGLTSVEFTEGEMRVHMVRERETVVVPMQSAPPVPPVPEKQAILLKSEVELTRDVDFNDLNAVTSPLVGVFYAAPSPEADAFVKIGSKVKKGDVLCIVEAMKLMNEIVAETDGEVVDVCVKNGDVVEYGQVLFKLH